MSTNVYFSKLQALQAGGIITAITQIDPDGLGGAYFTHNSFHIPTYSGSFSEYSESPTGDGELCCNFRKGGSIRSKLEPWLIENKISYRTDEELD